ncbi:AlpA family phage regulatory protein [Colwelliaceae bacterium BS250]
MKDVLISNNPKLRKTLLDLYGEKERLVRDLERKQFTSLSRSRTTQLEKEGKHPKRRILGQNSVAWLLSDLLIFINKDNPGLEA